MVLSECVLATTTKNRPRLEHICASGMLPSTQFPFYTAVKEAALLSILKEILCQTFG
jgi:hypothetical protein